MMGSWSVYCKVSNIVITDGQDCVFFILKKNKLASTYWPYIPATLPIFAQYDDYGGIENIVRDKNVEVIENHYGIGIEEFVEKIIRGDQENNNTKLDGLEYCFVDRKVYDFMSSKALPHLYNDVNFGSSGILTLLGFEKSDERSGDSRYTQKWFHGGVEFHSDGDYLHLAGTTGGLYCKEDLEECIKIPEDKEWVFEKTNAQLWRYYDKDTTINYLGYIFGINSSDFSFLETFNKILLEDKIKKLYDDLRKRQGIVGEYLNDLDLFGDDLAKVNTMALNMYPMSGYLAPHQRYITPQCGERKSHQIILENFAEINKSYLED